MTKPIEMTEKQFKQVLKHGQNLPKQEFAPQDFEAEYQTLCAMMGYQIMAQPAWKRTNHNTYELTIVFSVGRLPDRPA